MSDSRSVNAATNALSPNLKGALIALIAFALYSSQDAIIKHLGDSYHPTQIIFFSSVFGFPMLMLMQIPAGGGRSLRPRHPWWVGIRSVTTLIGLVSAIYAFSVLPLVEVYMLFFASPLLVTLMAIPMLGERVGIHRSAAILVGFVGVLVALRPGELDLSLGHAAAVLGVFCIAFGGTIVRRLGARERSITLLLYPMLTNLFVMGGAMTFFYQPMPLEDFGWFILLAIFYVFATGTMVWAYKVGEAVAVSPMHYSQLIWAVIFGSLFFDEFPTQWTFAGAAIIIASGLYILFREQRTKTSVSQPTTYNLPRPSTTGGAAATHAPDLQPDLQDENKP